MEALLAITFFAFGAISASFIGVVVGRLNTGQSFLKGRSRCDVCDTRLAPRSLVPLVSFFLSRGRAHCCSARLSPIAPLTEVLLGSLFSLAYFTLGFSYALPFMLLALALALALVLYDLTHQILPPVLLYPFIATSASVSFFNAPSLSDWQWTVFVALLLAASLAAIHFFSHGRAMGFADAPFVFGLALLVGAPTALPGFVFSFWIGALVGIVVLYRRPAGSRIGIEVPFAPFLAAGFLLAYFTQWNPFILIIAGTH